MTTEELTAAINNACPHCKAGNAPRFRYETSEYVHDFHAIKSDMLTPSLASQGGPAKVARGTFAHTFCTATKIRIAKSSGERVSG
jgi:hypothetical protein